MVLLLVIIRAPQDRPYGTGNEVAANNNHAAFVDMV